MITGIDNVGVAVADLERSVAFYQKLGFTKVFENDRGCTMMQGSAKLFVFAVKSKTAPPLRNVFEFDANPPGIDHVSFVVDSVDRTYAEAKSRGLDFLSSPADQSWGARAAALRDPDGNNLYLLSWLKQT